MKRKPLPPDLAQESSYFGLYKHTMTNAIDRGYKFELQFEDFKVLVNLPCHYCGSEGRQYSRYASGGPRRHPETIKNSYIRINGLDRVNNDLGYSKENCVASCTRCNFAKHTSTHAEFTQWIQQLIKHWAKGD